MPIELSGWDVSPVGEEVGAAQTLGVVGQSTVEGKPGGEKRALRIMCCTAKPTRRASMLKAGSSVENWSRNKRTGCSTRFHQHQRQQCVTLCTSMYDNTTCAAILGIWNMLDGVEVKKTRELVVRPDNTTISNASCSALPCFRQQVLFWEFIKADTALQSSAYY